MAAKAIIMGDPGVVNLPPRRCAAEAGAMAAKSRSRGAALAGNKNEEAIAAGIRELRQAACGVRSADY